MRVHTVIQVLCVSVSEWMFGTRSIWKNSISIGGYDSDIVVNVQCKIHKQIQIAYTLKLKSSPNITHTHKHTQLLEWPGQACVRRPVLRGLTWVERKMARTAETDQKMEREMENRREREGEKDGEIRLHIHLTPLPFLITLQRGVWNRNTFAHWHIRLWPF